MGRLSTGIRGCLDVCFSGQDGRSVASLTSTPPLELRGPFRRDRGADLYLLRNTTAGILSGDDYDLRASAEAGATVQVASSAASKALTMPGAGARSRTTITARNGSSLVWGPHVTLLQTGSRLCQETHVTLDAGAAVVLAEVIAFGRLASGQKYDFAGFDSTLVVSSPDRELYSESYALVPGPELCAALAGHGVLASAYLLGAASDAAASLSLLCLPELCGWSRLPNDAGLVVRCLADSASDGLGLVEQVLAIINSGAQST